MAARVLLVIALLLIVAVALIAIFARSRQDTSAVEWVVAKDGRMYVLAELVNDQMPIPPGANRDKLDAIVASFTFV